MLSDNKDVSRIVLCNIQFPYILGTDASEVEIKIDEFLASMERNFTHYELPYVFARAFSDFVLLITSGNFDVGVLNFPENLGTKDWERLYELIPQIASSLKGLVLISYNGQASFPEEEGRFGNVVKVFNPVDAEVEDIFEYIIACLNLDDSRPRTNFDAPWETEVHAYTTSFEDFPPEVATACEQYLLYFRNFLNDMGIQATANITHKAGKVLFSVIPSDPDEALDAIQTALQMYLHLPSIVDTNAIIPVSDIAAQNMKNELVDLKRKFRMASVALQMQQAMLESRDETISEQDVIINMQAEIVRQKDITIEKLRAFESPTEVFLTASRDEEMKRPKEIYICNNLIVLGQMDIFKLQSGIMLNLPEFYTQMNSGAVWIQKNVRKFLL